jgi:hypothetical protein
LEGNPGFLIWLGKLERFALDHLKLNREQFYNPVSWFALDGGFGESFPLRTGRTLIDMLSESCRRKTGGYMKNVRLDTNVLFGRVDELVDKKFITAAVATDLKGHIASYRKQGLI